MTHIPQRPMGRLFKYLKKYKKSFIKASSASIINKFFDLMPPILTAWFIDSVSDNIPFWIENYLGLSDKWEVVIFLSILTILIFGFESFFEWSYKKGFMRLAQRLQHDLRLDTYAQLQSREIAYFEKERTGNLMSILNDDVNQLERFLNTSFNEILQLVVLVIFAGTSLCLVSLPLGLLAMFPIPFIVWGSFYYQRKVSPYYREVRTAIGHLSNRLENNISGIMVIKSFTAERFEYDRVAAESRNYREANYKAIAWSTLYTPWIRMIIALGFSATLLIGAYWVIQDNGLFTLGSLAFYAMMIQRLLWPVTRLGVVFDDYERANASARRIFALLDTPNKIENPADAVVLKTIKGTVALEQVGFYYQKNQPILNAINLNIPAGTSIGIAGQTGAGKTTLIKLLFRFYDVTNGAIKIDGIDLRKMPLRNIRQNIALVSQEVYLFHGSIRENIAYGREDCDLDRVIMAAKKAELHDFVASLPHQYDTIIGERGIKLSGGQRQRLSIARAILKDAPILILDEATSAVDTETERAIQQNLNLLTQGKTAIIIAHRLSTIRHADQIIVLKEGQIAEKGTHEQLLKQQGIYTDLWQVQIGDS